VAVQAPSRAPARLPPPAPLPAPALPRGLRILPARPQAELEALPEIPYVPWRQFAASHAFGLGEHITGIGRTGRGKTTLFARGILGHYPFGLYLGTKEEDPSAYPYLLRHGWKMIKTPHLSASHQPHVIYRPGPFGISKTDKALVAERMRVVLDVAYRQKRWMIYADEFAFLADIGLESEFETIYRTGRGLEITMIANIQNPVFVPRVAFDQITHLFLWKQTERDRLRRIGEIAGDLGPQVVQALPDLPDFDVLYANTDSGELLRTHYPL
jgi:hypothetical protein